MQEHVRLMARIEAVGHKSMVAAFNVKEMIALCSLSTVALAF